MRSEHRHFIWVAGVLAACGGSTTGAPSSGSSPTGGRGGSENASAGGTPASGGSSVAGASESGGATSTGGAPSTGGVASIGGSSFTAGASSIGGTCAGPGFCPPSMPPPGVSLCGGVACAASEECCLLTLKCFDRTDTAACAAPPPDSDPQGRPTCASNADCASGDYCESGGSGICGGAGHCQSRTNCGSSFGATFCGCDGKTYPDVQTACLAGIRLGQIGACGQEALLGGGGASAGIKVVLCGTDSQCPSGQHCCAITGNCYDDAHAALCAPPPPGTSRACLTDADCPYAGDGEYCAGDGCDGPGGCRMRGACDPVLDSVCGCDGKTYLNAGCADSAGMRVASTGSCP